jgi:hypothetical protein
MGLKDRGHAPHHQQHASSPDPAPAHVEMISKKEVAPDL